MTNYRITAIMKSILMPKMILQIQMIWIMIKMKEVTQKLAYKRIFKNIRYWNKKMKMKVCLSFSQTVFKIMISGHLY